jgi:hypothetical protein
VAIGGCSQQLRHTRVSRCAHDIDDWKRRLQISLKHLADLSRKLIGPAARTPRHNKLYRPAGILCLSEDSSGGPKQSAGAHRQGSRLTNYLPT